MYIIFFKKPLSFPHFLKRIQMAYYSFFKSFFRFVKRTTKGGGAQFPAISNPSSTFFVEKMRKNNITFRFHSSLSLATNHIQK